jgi:hypothetical protein
MFSISNLLVFLKDVIEGCMEDGIKEEFPQT